MNVSHFGQNVSDFGNKRSSLWRFRLRHCPEFRPIAELPSGRRACLDRRVFLGDKCSANPAWSFPLTPCFSMLQRPWNRLHRARFRVSWNSLRRPRRRGFDWPVPGRRLQIGDAPAPVPCLTDPLVGKRHITKDRILPLSESFCQQKSSHDPGASGRMTEQRGA